MFGRFKMLGQILKTGRLALRLFRDPRVPMGAKLILGATALYLGSPIDVVPDWFPLVGQADDLVAVLAGLNLFIRACPRWLVAEHEDRMNSRRRSGVDDRPDAEYGSRPGGQGAVIEGRYHEVR
jgi:uncharacterized membrane protein YkvA (DUF1232 family)